MREITILQKTPNGLAYGKRRLHRLFCCAVSVSAIASSTIADAGSLMDATAQQEQYLIQQERNQSNNRNQDDDARRARYQREEEEFRQFQEQQDKEERQWKEQAAQIRRETRPAEVSAFRAGRQSEEALIYEKHPTINPLRIPKSVAHQRGHDQTQRANFWEVTFGNKYALKRKLLYLRMVQSYEQHSRGSAEAVRKYSFMLAFAQRVQRMGYHFGELEEFLEKEKAAVRRVDATNAANAKKSPAKSEKRAAAPAPAAPAKEARVRTQTATLDAEHAQRAIEDEIWCSFMEDRSRRGDLTGALPVPEECRGSVKKATADGGNTGDGSYLEPAVLDKADFARIAAQVRAFQEQKGLLEFFSD